MTFKSTLLFASLISLSAVSCKQTASVTGTENLGDTVPDTVIVDMKTAKEYVYNYSSHAGYVDQTPEEIAQKKQKKPDTRAIWFSKERLQQMLAQLEKEKGSGVRFYLITYNNSYDPAQKYKTPPPPEKYWGYNTLMMVSTRDSLVNKDLIHFDYYTDRTVGAEVKGKVKNKGFIVTYTPENRGEICPPPANCNDDGATLITDKP